MVTEPKLVNGESTQTSSHLNPGEGMKKIPSSGSGRIPDVDVGAAQEAEELEQQANQIKSEKKRNKFRRGEKLKDQIHNLKVISVWVALVLLNVVLLVWVLHLVLPLHWHWIKDAEILNTMRTILFAVGGGLVGAILRKFLD